MCTIQDVAYTVTAEELQNAGIAVKLRTDGAADLLIPLTNYHAVVSVRKFATEYRKAVAQVASGGLT